MATIKYTEKIGLRLTPEQKDEIRILAKQDGRSICEEIRVLIRDAVEKKNLKSNQPEYQYAYINLGDTENNGKPIDIMHFQPNRHQQKWLEAQMKLKGKKLSQVIRDAIDCAIEQDV